MKVALRNFSLVFIFLFLAWGSLALDFETKTEKKSCINYTYEKAVSCLQELPRQCANLITATSNLAIHSGKYIGPIILLTPQIAAELVNNNTLPVSAPFESPLGWSPDYKFGIGVAAIIGITGVCGYFIINICSCTCNCSNKNSTKNILDLEYNYGSTNNNNTEISIQD